MGGDSITFEDIAMSGKCDVCGKKDMVAVLSSAYGALSLAYCKDCCDNNLEPYGIMLSYIACGGKFPEGISPQYINNVRRILKALNISEEKFTKDCNSFWDNYAETE